MQSSLDSCRENRALQVKSGSNILVVCHDAGGAEVVSAWVRRNPGNRYRFVLAGPASRIFADKLPSAEAAASPEDLGRLIEGSDVVLTGTSWASDLEKSAIRQSKERRVHVVSFLDHWSNYPERFEYHGELVVPDELWIGDQYALKLAKETFRDTPIRLVDNPYLMDIRDEIRLRSQHTTAESGCCHILYVCEPVSVHARKASGDENAFGYTEFEAMDLFVSHLRSLVRQGGNIQVRIRPHPSEPADKYTHYVEKEPGRLEIAVSRGNSLIDDCIWSDRVVGMNSMALVIALEAGKKVYCCIPGHSKPMDLPHEGILNFLELNKI